MNLLVDRELARLPFPVQLRRRLERLGPTYIKLGQILSLREDLLPRPVTDELKKLLDRLPAVPFEVFRSQIESELGRPVDRMFLSIEPEPLGSASIAQVHRATTVEGYDVVPSSPNTRAGAPLATDATSVWSVMPHELGLEGA